MLRVRVLPVLLLKESGLYKTIKFKAPKYVGDPINAVKIFNEKKVDELILIDMTASKLSSEPNYDLIENIATECFMPLSYGGGIKNFEQAAKIIKLGVEKIILNSILLDNRIIAKKISEYFGSSSTVACVDIKKKLFSNEYYVYNHTTGKLIDIPLIEYLSMLVEAGVGEIIINNVNLDGKMSGYDIPLMKKVVQSVDVPVVALGGAGKVDDFVDIVKEAKVNAVAAGSFFVFTGEYRAVLITYPEYSELEEKLNS